MSFSKEIKKEILDNGFQGNKCCLAFLCGLVYSSAEYEVEGQTIKDFYIITDVEFLFEPLKKIIQSIYPNAEMTVEESYKISLTQYYKIGIDGETALSILLDIKAISKNGKTLEVNGEVADDIVENEDGLKGFMSGAFIGSGTSSIKLDEQNRTTTGYHVELSNQNYPLLSEIANVMAQFDILAKLTKRKNVYVLYVKDAEEVSNMLALMGASNAVLKLQNEIITRSVRNKVNRQNNCYTSNYNKTLDAAFKQLDAIRVLDDKLGLDSLSEDLQQVALLRLANTEESLEELLKLSKYPMTKSALNHKFQKLIKLAEKVKGK